MRLVWISALLLAGCMTELPQEDPAIVQARRACTELEGRSFTSVSEGECGLTPDGPATCLWHITFSAHDGTMSRFDWDHSDVGESGYVTCEGDAIRSDEARLYEGHFDSNLDLVWDAVAYTLAP